MLTIHTTRTQFHVRCLSVSFAGSRHGSVVPQVANLLVGSLATHGFSFLVGCAPGIDACFRAALARQSAAKAIVACAFTSREKTYASPQLTALTVVPSGLSPAAALHRRTVWMVRRASLLVLFPIDPPTGKWGKGSTLAFNTALYNLKPVFVVTSIRLTPIPSFLIVAASLCNEVSGYWVLPYPDSKGVCGDEW